MSNIHPGGPSFDFWACSASEVFRCLRGPPYTLTVGHTLPGSYAEKPSAWVTLPVATNFSLV